MSKESSIDQLKFFLKDGQLLVGKRGFGVNIISSDVFNQQAC